MLLIFLSLYKIEFFIIIPLLTKFYTNINYKLINSNNNDSNINYHYNKITNNRTKNDLLLMLKMIIQDIWDLYYIPKYEEKVFHFIIYIYNINVDNNTYSYLCEPYTFTFSNCEGSGIITAAAKRELYNSINWYNSAINFNDKAGEVIIVMDKIDFP